MNDKKRDFETACAAAVKARNFTEAAKAASGAADCAEILASRTAGLVSAAYAKEAASWRDLAKKLEGRKNGSPARNGSVASGEAPADGGEWLVSEKPDVTFDDIAGMEEAKRVIDEMVILPMKAPEKARSLGLAPGGGVLLFGPPGTGKTMLGKAIAGALDAPFFYASGADLRSKWYGESEQRLSQLMNAAKSMPVAVVFLDEIESLLPKRTENSHAADNRVVTQFLSDLGGFKDSKNLLLVLGATNKPWEIDEAVFRTGRFDEKVYIGPPDKAAREKILELNIRGARLADDVSLGDLASAMENASGSDMAAVVSAAKRAALARSIRDDSDPVVTLADFEDARKRIPLSITEEILKPYRDFIEERFGSV
ncbi:MAG: ATP-binding protein [Kiritimatiellae bacterium]|nr:ATP-binding protein [Kiritimatiellia bacterium]